MTLYEFMRGNEPKLSALVKAGVISPKYLIWRDMYEYVSANSTMKKKYRRSKSQIIADTAATFRTSTDTVKRAINTMKQQVDYEAAKAS